jgi:hypothetical protein
MATDLRARFSSAKGKRTAVLRARSEETASDPSRKIFTTHLRAIGESAMTPDPLLTNREVIYGHA